jgi:hypothetical protein
VFRSVHPVQLAMPGGEEAAARAFFVEVLGMVRVPPRYGGNLP